MGIFSCFGKKKRDTEGGTGAQKTAPMDSGGASDAGGKRDPTKGSAKSRDANANSNANANPALGNKADPNAVGAAEANNPGAQTSPTSHGAAGPTPVAASSQPNTNQQQGQAPMTGPAGPGAIPGQAGKKLSTTKQDELVPPPQAVAGGATAAAAGVGLSSMTQPPAKPNQPPPKATSRKDERSPPQANTPGKPADLASQEANEKNDGDEEKMMTEAQKREAEYLAMEEEQHRKLVARVLKWIELANKHQSEMCSLAVDPETIRNIEEFSDNESSSHQGSRIVSPKTNEADESVDNGSAVSNRNRDMDVKSTQPDKLGVYTAQ